jgi:transposase
MANERLCMTKVRQVMRLRQSGMSYRNISKHLDISRDSSTKYGSLFELSGLSYSEIEQMSDLELKTIFDNKNISKRVNVSDRSNLDTLTASFPEMEKQLNKIGITRLRLWSKYKIANPTGYNYSSFCDYFRQWQKSCNVSMHFEHKAGDKMFIDFTGKKLYITDLSTGELIETEVFVSVLGASQLTYVEAVASQKKEDFIIAVENALHYYGGVPQAIVPDNLKSAVIKSSKYEPLLNKTFEDFALHYGTTILPARSYKPKDKSLVEGAVKIVYNRIFSVINEMIFFSIQDLNHSIRQELEKYNNIELTGKQSSRRQIFEETERKELKSLTLKRYEIKSYRQASVYKTSHIWLKDDEHYYSVPFKFINTKVQVLYTKTMVEIYHNHERIACHVRDRKLNGYTTVSDHMPSSHRFVADWNPDKFIKWARDTGKPTEEYIRKILQSKAHPEQGYKSCIGILSYGKKAGKDRLNDACTRAAYYNSFNYMTIKNILEKGLDKIAIDSAEQNKLPTHDNIRGSQYYK